MMVLGSGSTAVTHLGSNKSRKLDVVAREANAPGAAEANAPWGGRRIVSTWPGQVRKNVVMPAGFRRLFHRRLAAWWTLAIGLTVTTAVGWEMHREAVAMDRQRLAMRVAEVQSQLDARIEKSEMLLQHLRDYLTISGERRNQVFARWCYENGLTINCPWILGIAVATNRYDSGWRMNLPPEPSTWTKADWQTLPQLALQSRIECHLAMRSDLKGVVQFLADYDLKRSFQPKDPGAILDPLSSAIRGSRLGMSGHRTTMMDFIGGKEVAGTLFFVPVYEPGLTDILAVKGRSRYDQVCARWLNLSAIIVAAVDFKHLTDSIRDAAPADLGIEIFSSTSVLSSDTWLNPSEGGPHAADPRFKAYLKHHQTWPMYGQKFSIFFYTTPLFEAQSPRRLAKISGGAGTLLTLLATALVGVATRARSQQEQLTEQIRDARDALAAAQRERTKISRDLHDGTIQSLYAIQLGLERTLEQVRAAPERAGRELWLVRSELDTVISEIRQFITTDAEPVESVDFRAVLEALVQRAQAGTGARIALQCDASATSQLTGEQAVQLANIVREALSNSLRHGRPQAVRVTVHSESAGFVLEVADDGKGFDTRAPSRSGVGLVSMASRARDIGGHLEIQSTSGAGTRVRVHIPARSTDLGGLKKPAA